MVWLFGWAHMRQYRWSWSAIAILRIQRKIVRLILRVSQLHVLLVEVIPLYSSAVCVYSCLYGRVDMTEITMQRIFDYFFLYLMAMQSKREPSQAAANIRREQKKKKFACVSERGRGRTESCNNHHICCMPIWPTTTHLDIFMGISFSFVRIWLAHPIILVSYHLSTRSI